LDLQESTLEAFPEAWTAIAANKIILTGSNLEADVLSALEEGLLYTTIVSEEQE
jgi:hypothetical protein